MKWLPLYFKPQRKCVVVFGRGPRALRKLQFLARTDFPAQLVYLAANHGGEPDLSHIPNTARIDCFRFDSLSELVDATCKAVFVAVAASESDTENEQFADLMRSKNVLVHIAENAEHSDFLFPALVDRGDISVAISSAGAHPTLTRIIRSRIETVLPARLGELSRLAVEYRPKVRELFASSTARKKFWEKHLEGRVADLVFGGRDEEARLRLDDHLTEAHKSSESQCGEVYLVGAGPGDPDLLSFKALRLMRQADVVLYDRLVSTQILGLVRQDADLINVGKARSKHTMPQDGINELLAKLALEGKRVLRLKGGDPFIFGRGGEEIETLAAEGVPFQVVPGITAAAGCASYSGIPLTHRDYAQSVRFITGHLKNNTSDLKWQSLVSEHETLVFYMGLVALPMISKSLIKHGISPDMPVAVVSKGTLPEQQVVISSIDTIAKEVDERGIKAPTIIIVGRVVTLHEKLNWTS